MCVWKEHQPYENKSNWIFEGVFHTKAVHNLKDANMLVHVQYTCFFALLCMSGVHMFRIELTKTITAYGIETTWEN